MRRTLAIVSMGDMPAACILWCGPVLQGDRAQCEASGNVHGVIRALLRQVGLLTAPAHVKAIHPQAIRSRVLLMEVPAVFCLQWAAHGSWATEI